VNGAHSPTSSCLAPLARVTEVVYSIGIWAMRFADTSATETVGLRVRYVADGDRPCGTAGALRTVIDSAWPGELRVINGDSYLSLDLPAVEAAFAGSGCRH